MPNSVKYSTIGDTLSLKKGNFFFGVGDVGKGPSSATTYYNGVTPMSGGYTIYSYNVNQTSKISFYSVNGDLQLISYTNKISGQNYTTATQCLNWYVTQTNYACVNKNYEGIITNGLVLNLDAGFIPSYPTNGTTSYDLSYEGNNGTLVNGTPYSSLDGGYFMFDGTDDYINVGVGKSCNGFTGDFAVSVWVNRSPNGTTWGNIIGDYYTNNTFNPLEWQIMISNTAQLFVYNVTSGYVINPINSGFNTDSWINVVLSRIGSTITLYANSNTITTVTNGTTFGSSTGNINIGVDGNNSAEALNGKIANVLIYKNKGLTSSEVLQNYNAGSSRFNTSNIIKNNLILDLNASNAVSYPTTGTVWRDLSGYGNTGTLINGPTFDTTTKSFLFDGSDDYVNIPYNENLNTPNGATYEILIKPISSGEFINRGTSDATDNPRMYIYNTGMLYFDWSSIGVDRYSQSNVGAAPLNSWSHIIFIATPGDQLRIYVNGQQTSYSVASASMPSPLPNTINPIQIGRADWIPRYFNGNIGLVRLYNRSLTTSEILQNYYGAPIITDGLVMALDAGNLVSYPGSGTSWKDLTGNGNHVELINGPSYMSSGFFRNDADSYFSGSGTGTIPIGNSPYTMIVWVRQLSSVGWGFANGFISVGGFFTTNQSNALRTLNGTLGHFHHYWWGNDLSLENNGAGIDLDKWFMVSTTFDGTTRRIWVNGTPRSSDNPTGHNVTSTEIQISKTCCTEYQQGDVAIAQIYNRALSDDEMSQNFNAYKSRFSL